VNAKQFLTLLHKGNSLQKEDFQSLVRLHETFPYFALPKILAAKYEKRNTGGSSTEILHWAAIQSPNRKRLKQIIEEEIEFLPPSETPTYESMVDLPAFQENEDKPTPASTNQDSREDILRRLEENLNRFKNNSKKGVLESEQPKEVKPEATAEDLIATIKKKEKKAILDTRKKEQNNLIKAFNKKSIQMATIKENQDSTNLTDLSKNSTTFNDKIVSESFARLLVKQNNKQQAVEIYRKLILKFPDKSAYFAALIKELED
jgi:hypothetical protein